MKKCILVADDDEMCRELLAKALTKYDYEVTTAWNGNEALDFFKNKHYDLLITDIEMPGITGIDLLKEVKIIAPSVGVIIVTGRGTMESYFDSMNNGAFEYLIKPLKLGELKKTVTKFFNHLLAVKPRAYNVPTDSKITLMQDNQTGHRGS